MTTLESAAVKRRRVCAGGYLILVDDGGGFDTAGQVMRRATKPVSWGWSTGDAKDWGKWGVEGTLGKAVDECALAHIRHIRGID